MANQLPLYLPQRPTNEILSDRLATLNEQFYCGDAHPARQDELYHEIVKLRALLGLVGKDGPSRA